MAVSFATFERLKTKGINAYKKDDYAAAKTYLVEAAECMVELAETAKKPEVRRQHEEVAAELIDLAKECDARRSRPKSRRGRVREKEEDSGADASDWIVKDKPDIGFDDIAGLDDVKEDIRLRMIYPFSHPELANRYGVNVGGGVLLYGPPGTGKTMMAKAIAHEIGATFFVISPAQVLSKWVGEAEQNIRKLFDAAKAEDTAVIFIDEVEALVPRRKSDASSVMQRVVPQILQELEGFDRTHDRALLFVGATNKPWMLDEAMLRPGRLDTMVYVDLPDAPARYRLLEIHLGDRPLAGDVDIGKLCDMLGGYSGADIKNIAQRAATIPFMESIAGREARPISMKDLVTVIEATPCSVRETDLARYERFADTGK
ncbi:MAG: AAA family ATPase [Planctomycetota bacterium]|jgi:transitional endoplasmic reticulum ATPase